MDDIPFSDVLIHSTIQAPDGRRMSKSLGTGIDPLELVEEFGADATRYGLLKMSSTQDVRFDRGAIEEGAKLANKLWNAVRFALGQAEDGVAPAAPTGASPLEDRWIASRLELALTDVVRHIGAYDFSAASKVLYAFVYEFCDWYVEAIKPRLYGDDLDQRAAATATLLWSLDRVLRLAHPMIPFVTEAIWEQLPGERGLLMLAGYPEVDPSLRDAGADERMADVIRRVSSGRANPAEPLALPEAYPDEQLVRRLAPKKQQVVVGTAVPAAADPGLQRETLERELARAVAERDRAQGMLANERFISKAPPAKVQDERDKLARYAAEATDLELRLAAIGSG
jgi:valyl-tRNA synthetase